MSKPICPRCNSFLDLTLRSKVRFYICKNGCGEAISVIALRNMADPKLITKAWMESVHSNSNVKIKCPHCFGQMSSVKTQLMRSNVELDICRSCMFFWLDHAEVNVLPIKKDIEDIQEKNRNYAEREFAKFVVLNKTENLDSYVESAGKNNGVDYLFSIFGLPVESDYESLKLKPFLTWFIIFCVLVASLVSFKNPTFFDFLVLNSSSSYLSIVRQSVFSFFIQNGYINLFINIYFLWIFGDNVEDELGRKNYLLLILTSFLISTLGYKYSLNGTGNFIGAGVVISAIVVFYILRFPHKHFIMRILSIHTLFYRKKLFMNFKISAKFLALIFLAKELINYFYLKNTISPAANLSYFLGLLVGICFYIYFSPKKNLQNQLQSKS